MRFSATTIGIALFAAALIGAGVSLFLIFKPSRSGWDDGDQALIAFPRGTITAEVASSTLKQYRGLSGHAPLAQDAGMLFVFGSAHKYPFVMRGMTFPLDFIWIADGHIVDLDENIPPPQPGVNPEIVIPKNRATMVLEVSAGTIARLNIADGDPVTITKKSKNE